MDCNVLKQYRQTISDGLFGSVLPFWERGGPDDGHGGIRTCLDREGKVFSQEKSVWMQGRGGWMFAHLYRLYGGKEEWLSISKSCLSFLNTYCIDPADGRLYFVVGDDGAPFRKRRYVFSEYFYIMASAEYYAATGETRYLDDARKYYALVTDIYADPAKDPFHITPKFLDTAPPMRGLGNTLVLLLASRTMRVCDPERAVRYVQTEKRLISEILEYHFQPRFGALLESVGPDGSYLGACSGGRVINPGHCLEAAWYLAREAEELGDGTLLARAEEIYEGAFRCGWDQTYGGLLYFVDAEGAPPQAYEHDMKLWWVHTEALIAAVRLYRMTGKERYFQDFERLMDYTFRRFWDEKHGEWYGYLRRDGLATEPACKGNIFKGPFHVPRMHCEVLSELTKLMERQEKGEREA